MASTTARGSSTPGSMSKSSESAGSVAMQCANSFERIAAAVGLPTPSLLSRPARISLSHVDWVIIFRHGSMTARGNLDRRPGVLRIGDLELFVHPRDETFGSHQINIEFVFQLDGNPCFAVVDKHDCCLTVCEHRFDDVEHVKDALFSAALAGRLQLRFRPGKCPCLHCLCVFHTFVSLDDV